MATSFTLIIDTGLKAKTSFPIKAPWTTVGRSHTDDVCLAECVFVEKNHFALCWEGADLTLIDSGAPGRFLVNEEVVLRNGKVPLKPGDRIILGDTTLTVGVGSDRRETGDA